MIGHRHALISTGVAEDLASKSLMIVTDIHLKNGVEDDPEAPGAINESLNRYFYSAFEELEKYVTDVNTNQPDLALCLGDMCDSPNDFTRWNQIWGAINSGIKKEIVPGNHDLDDLTFAQLLTTIGYDSRPIVAGSQFNQTFALGSNTRMILLDSTFDSGDTHSNSYTDRHIHSTAPAWIQTTLENTTENNVIIGMHVGPHLVEFNQTQAADIYSRIDTVKATRPDLNVTFICGHEHREVIEENTTAHANSLGLTMGALIYYENGRYNTLTIDQVSETIDYDTIIYDYSLGESFPPFIANIDTTLGDGNPTFQFPFVNSATAGEYDMVLRWGDGTRTFVHGQGSDLFGTLQKTFASGGVKTVTIEGTMTAWSFNALGDKDKWTSLAQWGNVKQKTLSGFAYNCTNLSSIPNAPITGCEEVTTMLRAFRGTSSLTQALPSNLLSDLGANLETLAETFYLSGFTGSIPAGLLDTLTGLKFMNRCFHTSNLNGDVPANLFANNPLIESLVETWRSAQSNPLVAGLLDPLVNLTTVGSMCRNNTACDGKTIPNNYFINNVLITNYSLTFIGVKNMVIGNMFNLTALGIVTTFNDFMDVSDVADSATGTVQDIWNYALIAASVDAFRNQTALSNYAAIPNDWKGL